MKVLWVTYDLPYPTNSGGKLRAYHLIKNLSKRFDITLFSFYRSDEQLEAVPVLKKFIRRVVVFRRRPVWSIRNLVRATFSDKPLLLVSYESADLEQSLRESLEKREFDAVHLEFFGVASVLSSVKKAGVPVVLGNENIEYQIYQKYVANVRNRLLRFLMDYDVCKMKRWEEKLWRLADVNLAVSGEDSKVMKEAGVRNASLIPNGVEAQYYLNFRKAINRTVSNRALFTGNLRYPQNGEAVKWFAVRVLPLIKKHIPSFKLVIVSGYKPNWLSAFSDSIELHNNTSSEFVDFVDKGDIFVLPVWIKSGTNIKLLQAAAVGFPIVSTTAGLSGYNFLAGHEVLSAQSPEEFAHSIIRLLRSYQLRKTLSQNVLRVVRDYEWSKSATALGDIYEKIKPY